MNGCRFCVRLAWLATCLGGPFALAEQTPTYQKLHFDAPAPRMLQTVPLTLSEFPTTFSMALSAENNELRTVDIHGRVWQRPVRPGKKPVLLTRTNREPACAVLSRDAALLAFANLDGGVTVMHLDTKQTLFRDTSVVERTATLNFSPDSGSLAGVTVGGNVRVWDVDSGQLVRELAARPGPVQTAVFSPDGQQLAITSFTREVKLYRLGRSDNARAATAVQVIDSAGPRVTALAFSPGGRQLVIASADGTALVHDLTGARSPVALGSHPFAIWSITFEQSGPRMAAGSWDGTIKLWDTNSWDPLQSVKSHEESVAAMIFDYEKGLISAGLDGRLLGWLPEVPGIQPFGMIAGRPDSVWVAVYSQDGKKLFVGGRQKRFELWNAKTNELLVTREGHPTTRCAAFSPDGRTLATGGDDGSIFLCDTHTGQTRKTLLRHRGAVSAVVFAHDGQTLVSAGDGGFVKVWDTATGQEKAAWHQHQQQIYCANISPDGKWLITGGGNWTTGDAGELLVWDPETGHVRAELEGHKLAVWAIVFTPDGKYFASSDSSGAVKVWNLQTLKELRTLQHGMWVRALALAPDGQTLAVGRGDGSVRLWDTTTWTQRASCEGHDSFTFWLQYAPGGGTLASSGNDGTVRFWRTER